MTQASPPLAAPETDTEHFLAIQWKLNQALGRHLAPLIERAHGVGLKDLMVLGHIRSGVHYPTELAGELQIPKHMTSRVLDDLLGKGLIERSIDPQDSRRTRLSVSPAGLEVLDAARVTVDATIQQLFDHIPADDRARVMDAIRTLAHAAQTAFGGHA
ncbi:winged helix-turn-helix transcriptional regulator [Deinococcus sp. KSM4-11]|uniref:MarR family winged helix-turn-helix transcriptional regulator n=1 Tax=Deinococcus sp. KSM4-11 TaxID=2568654 RepID=UPI0010A3F2FB|nr:MarR family winged helix-turn-helix transcriptional regulator [Deinococcus sp. KSM4-11]THF85005.1 winged helix-turn-helix transcriptional regulator [Deinococcus sp. KSM4-11]